MQDGADRRPARRAPAVDVGPPAGLGHDGLVDGDAATSSCATTRGSRMPRRRSRGRGRGRSRHRHRSRPPTQAHVCIAAARPWPVSSSKRANRSGSATCPRILVAPTTPWLPRACAVSTPSRSSTVGPASAWSSCSAGNGANATAPWSTCCTRWPATWASSCTRAGAADRARGPGRRAARGPAAQRIPAAGRGGALRVRGLRRNGRAPGPGRRARAGRPVPHRPRGRRQADAPDGGLARRPRQAPARRGVEELVRPAGHGPRPDHGGDAHRSLHVEFRDVRRVPPGGLSRHVRLLHPQGARLHLVHDGAAAHPRRRGDRHGHVGLVRLGPALLREGPRPGRAAGQAGRFGREPGPRLRPGTPDLPRAPAQPAARRHPGRGRVGRGGALPARLGRPRGGRRLVRRGADHRRPGRPRRRRRRRSRPGARPRR